MGVPIHGKDGLYIETGPRKGPHFMTSSWLGGRFIKQMIRKTHSSTVSRLVLQTECNVLVFQYTTFIIFQEYSHYSSLPGVTWCLRGWHSQQTGYDFTRHAVWKFINAMFARHIMCIKPNPGVNKLTDRLPGQKVTTPVHEIDVTPTSTMTLSMDE